MTVSPRRAAWAGLPQGLGREGTGCRPELRLSDCECHLLEIRRYYFDILVCQELEKPSPPQKPLPADPRSSRAVRSPPGVKGHGAVQGPSVVCGPAPKAGATTPVRPVPHPKR